MHRACAGKVIWGPRAEKGHGHKSLHLYVFLYLFFGFSPLSFLCPIHFCLLLFGLIVIVLSFLFQMFLFSNETASKGVYLGGWVGRWGRSGRSWRRRNCNQNVLYKTLFSIKNENH